MRIKSISRRKFIKTNALYCATVALIPSVILSDNNKESATGITLDSNYIIINGWVLLKSDAGMSV